MWSSSVEIAQVASPSAAASPANLRCTPLKSGFFSASTKRLVSAAVEPCAAREADSWASTARTLDQAASSKFSVPPLARTPPRMAFSSSPVSRPSLDRVRPPLP